MLATIPEQYGNDVIQSCFTLAPVINPTATIKFITRFVRAYFERKAKKRNALLDLGFHEEWLCT